ncbi:hypothetical protein SPBR_02062 [Sporothrix brasiliensis 5110]|uniref:Roadblock/LAMTOR2 domain-containing protein n=1 Tax=Sporothrix brasiliensis 5110 TaxID=1398154 RepID=A0A0C2IXN7_9PEZI|nr:uncharacterized protein SPBR_02062 [Sporothrix brasiliensis 5110]KIH91515.1 hypothetical protein SPBR_02062 [Sporothrix brasiliensis 5110]
MLTASSRQGSGTSDVLDETLGRLAKKAGVKATILLDRATGSILKMEGQISSIRTSIGRGNGGSGSGSHGATKESNGSTMVTSSTSMAAGGGFAEDALLSGAGGDNGVPADDTKGARELAGLVWNYVKTSGDLVEAIDTEDELKLLRLRTKKQELVIVPDPKYLLIVIHDTPPA